MRPRKLSKSTKPASNGFPDLLDDDSDLTFKASIDDLRSATSRQSLRQNFIGAFPETQLRPSLESIPDSEMPNKLTKPHPSSNGVSRGGDIDASSSSSTGVNGAGVKTRPAKQESKAKFDIAEVISLLQDLRSIASPAELVALHKALLPTRDSVVQSPGTVPSFEDVVSPISPMSFTRQRSMLPPAVATRGRSASEELPRMSNEPVSPLTPRPHTEPASKKDWAALDLASDPSFASNPRSPSPNEHGNTFMGAYRPGTLRIVNGRASPEAGALCRSVEAGSNPTGEPKVPDVFETAPNTPYDKDTFSAVYSNPSSEPRRKSNLVIETKPQNDKSSDKPPAGSQGSRTSRRASEPASSTVTTPNETQTQLSNAVYSPATPELPERSRERSQSYVDEWRNRNPVQARLRLDTSVSKPAPNSSKQSSRRSSQATSRQSLKLAQGTESGTQSPLRKNSLPIADQQATADMPRFAQRWSHRLSHISYDQASEAQPASDSREDQDASRNLSRLSTVTDKTVESQPEQPTVSAMETPEMALAKLNGHVGHRLFNQSKPTATGSKPNEVPSSEDAPQEPKTLQPGKFDRTPSSDAPLVADGPEKGEEGSSMHADGVAEPPHKASQIVPLDEDEVSLYSFRHILSSPSLLSGLATPSAPSARGSMKHLSILGLSTAPSTTSLEPPVPSLPGSINRSNVQPQPEKSTHTPPKKLPKSNRISIRKSLRFPMKQEKRQSKLSTFAYVPDDLEDAYLGHLDVEAPGCIANRSTTSSQPVDGNSRVVQSTPKNTSSHDLTGSSPNYQRVPVPSAASRPRHGNFPHNPKYLVTDALLTGPDPPPYSQVHNEVRDQNGSAIPGARSRNVPTTSAAATEPPVEVQNSRPMANEGFTKTPLDFDASGSIADIVRKAAQARKVQEKTQTNAAQPADYTAEIVEFKSKKTLKKNQHREDNEIDGTAIAELECSSSLAHSKRPDSEESWKYNAKAERQLHRAIVETFRKGSITKEQHNGPCSDALANSPTIVVSQPSASNVATDTGPKSMGPAYSNAETDESGDLTPIASKKSANGDFAWRESTATFVTVVHCKEDNQSQEERVDSAFSVKTYQSDGSNIEQSQDGVALPPSNGPSSTAAEANRVEHSRAESLAKLTGASSSGTPSLEKPRCSLHKTHDSLDSLINRYSAGLPYGWSAGRNFRDTTGPCQC